MKTSFNPMDIVFTVFFACAFIALFLSEPVMDLYKSTNTAHPFISAFFKFALLATFGESLAQRIATGSYSPKNYGLLPKAILWGLLGIAITAAFIIFSTGAPLILNKLGLPWGATALASTLSIEKIIAAFCVSLTMNCFFAPILMLTHSLTDAHVAEHNGSLISLIKKPLVPKYLKNMNWENFWNLAIVRNILLFWIPMHTITFLLPENFRVLFAAILGTCLGLILTFIKMISK